MIAALVVLHHLKNPMPYLPSSQTVDKEILGHSKKPRHKRRFRPRRVVAALGPGAKQRLLNQFLYILDGQSLPKAKGDEPTIDVFEILAKFRRDEVPDGAGGFARAGCLRTRHLTESSSTRKRRSACSRVLVMINERVGSVCRGSEYPQSAR